MTEHSLASSKINKGRSGSAPSHSRGAENAFLARNRLDNILKDSTGSSNLPRIVDYRIPWFSRLRNGRLTSTIAGKASIEVIDRIPGNATGKPYAAS